MEINLTILKEEVLNIILEESKLIKFLIIINQYLLKNLKIM